MECVEYGCEWFLGNRVTLGECGEMVLIRGRHRGGVEGGSWGVEWGLEGRCRGRPGSGKGGV